MKLIDKDALVAEIEKRINFNEKLNAHSRLDECNAILSFLDTLEVKEVDLNKEIDKYFFNFVDPDTGEKLKRTECWLSIRQARKFAKHFFELGMRVNNPITAADRGMAEEIIINLKRVEQDYRIDLTKEIEWVRSKVKKGM